MGATLFAFHFTVLLSNWAACYCNFKFNDGDFQQVCTSVGTLQNNHENSHFRVQDSNNADLLLDSGRKLSNIIVILCSKLLDYILLKLGSRY